MKLVCPKSGPINHDSREKRWRSGTITALMILCVVFSLCGCNPAVFHSFRIEPGETMVEISASDLDWIVLTTLEAEKFDCEPLVDPNHVVSGSRRRLCTSSFNSFFANYGLEGNVVELTFSAESIPLLPGRAERYFRRFERHAEILDVSFEAAGLVVACSKPRSEFCSID